MLQIEILNYTKKIKFCVKLTLQRTVRQAINHKKTNKKTKYFTLDLWWTGKLPRVFPT